MPVNEGQLFRALETIRDLGSPAVAMVHAEDCDLYSVFEKKARESDLEGLEAWAAARPSIVSMGGTPAALSLPLRCAATIAINMNEAIMAARRELQSVVRFYRKAGWQQAVGSSGTINAIECILLAAEHDGVRPEGLAWLTERMIAVGNVAS